MSTPEKSLSDSYSEVFAMEASKDVNGLIEIINNSQKKLVIKKAVSALGRIKSPEAVEPLMELVLKKYLGVELAHKQNIVHHMRDSISLITVILLGIMLCIDGLLTILSDLKKGLNE